VVAVAAPKLRMPNCLARGARSVQFTSQVRENGPARYRLVALE
jgi:hypothetical protein